MIDFMGVNTGSSKETFQKKLGNRIRELRRQQELTQEQLAERADVHPSFIGPIERAEKIPGLLTLVKLAKALKVPAYQLLMLEPMVSVKQRTLQELVDILKDRPERDTEILLGIERELLRKFP